MSEVIGFFLVILHFLSATTSIGFNVDKKLFNRFSPQLEKIQELRDPMYGNHVSLASITSPLLNQECQGYDKAWQHSSYHIDMIFIPAREEVGNSSLESGDITLSLQFSESRKNMVELFATHWAGPIVYVFFGTEVQSRALKTFVGKSSILSARKNIAFRLVQYEDESLLTNYPLNLLRNIGLKNISTPFVFPLDIDVLVRRGMYERMRKFLATAPSRKAVYIVPLFKTESFDSSEGYRKAILDVFPQTKADLLKYWLADCTYIKLLPFLSSDYIKNVTDIYAPKDVFHGATNYKRWATTSKPYKVKYAGLFEPNIVFRTMPLGTPMATCKKNTAKYGFVEEYAGRSFDKGTLPARFAASGYDFVVLPNEFTIHLPHQSSEARLADEEDKKNGHRNMTHSNCVRRFYILFKLELVNTCAKFLKKNVVHKLACHRDKDFDGKNCSFTK